MTSFVPYVFSVQNQVCFGCIAFWSTEAIATGQMDMAQYNHRVSVLPTVHSHAKWMKIHTAQQQLQ